MDGVNICEWAKGNREELNALLSKHGGILFRGFKVEDTKDFHLFIRQVSGELLEYKDHATPRSAVQNQIYTSTDFAADQWIELHNEMAYGQEWPMKIFFTVIYLLFLAVRLRLQIVAASMKEWIQQSGRSLLRKGSCM